MRSKTAFVLIILMLFHVSVCMAESLCATGESFQSGLRVGVNGSVYVETHDMPIFLLSRGKSTLYRLDVQSKELKTVIKVAYGHSDLLIYGDRIVYSDDPFLNKLLVASRNDEMWYMTTPEKDHLLHKYDKNEKIHRTYFCIRGQLYYSQWPMDIDKHDEGYWERLWKVTDHGDVFLIEVENAQLIPYDTIISIEGEYNIHDNVIKLYDVVHEQIIEIPYDPLVFADIKFFYVYDIIMRDEVIYLADNDWVVGYDIPSQEIFVIREGTGRNQLYADGDWIYICDSEMSILYRYSPVERRIDAELPYPAEVECPYKAVINGKLVTWDTVNDIVLVTDLESGKINRIEIK